jgi:cytochrome c oxidase assembly factor CtaG
MLLLGLPYDVIQWLTRPAAVDAALLRLHRPPVAIITVTVIVVGSMAPAMVRAQSSSPLARGLLMGLIVLAGLILWIPVLGRIPGIPRLKPVVRFGYLVAQAVAPAFLSFIFIFSRHPLYGAFARSHAAIGLRPLTDQQIAGFVSKLSMLFVLLTVGAVVLARAPMAEEEFSRDDPLVWADVEREFERADRAGRSGPGTDVTPGPPPGGDLSGHGQGVAESPEGEGPEP